MVICPKRMVNSTGTCEALKTNSGKRGNRRVHFDGRLFVEGAMDLHTESAELNSSVLGCKVGNDTALYALGSVQIRYN